MVFVFLGKKWFSLNLCYLVFKIEKEGKKKLLICFIGILIVGWLE